ncbi:hemicentin-2 [Aulostomus maculatus]
MNVLAVVAVVALIHGSYATLLIKGPTQAVLEGESVTLECQYSDSESNISDVHFEVSYKYMSRWRQVWERSWCFYWMNVERMADRIALNIPNAGRSLEGFYRCVSDADNVTAPDNSSQVLALNVQYMGELTLSREGYRSYLGIPQELKVQLGENVVVQCSASSSEEPQYYWQKEGDDWILPSSQLTLKKVSAADGGQYSCIAEHPSEKSLIRKRTVTITLLPEDARWYESSNGRLLLMTSAAAASLLVFIVSMSVFLCRRAKQAKTNKGPIDDRSQKKPIYKGSAESIESSAHGDKQPLV